MTSKAHHRSSSSSSSSSSREFDDAHIYVAIIAPPITIPVTRSDETTVDVGDITLDAVGMSARVLSVPNFFPSAPQVLSELNFSESNIYVKDDFDLENGRIVVEKSGTYEFAYVIQGFINLGSALLPGIPDLVIFFPPTPGAAGALIVNGVPIEESIAPMGTTQVGIVKLNEGDKVTIGNASPSGPPVFLAGLVTVTSNSSQFGPAPGIIGNAVVSTSSPPPGLLTSLMLKLIDYET